MKPFFDAHTREQLGWEMQCQHPDHQFPRQCAKTLKNTAHGRTEDVTIRMLYHWASLGSQVSSRDLHTGKIWQRVEADKADDELPTLFEEVLEFGDRLDALHELDDLLMEEE